MSRKSDNKNCDSINQKTKISNENDNFDSGFLSGQQDSTIELSDLRPDTKDIPVSVVVDSSVQHTSDNFDSGYIDDDKITQSGNDLGKVTEKLSNLNIKSSNNSKTIKNNTKVQLQNKKENWEIYYQQNDDGDTQLHWACLTGYIDVVAALIRMVPHPCLLDIQNDDAQTPMHIASLSDQPKIIRMLLIAGADPTIQDLNGNTPLLIASMYGHLQCVKALTEKINTCELKEAQDIYINRRNNFGALKHQTKTSYSQIDTKKISDLTKSTLEIRNYDGERCVHLATQSSYTDILRQLIYCGADINAREGKSGRTPLHIAIEQKNENIINFILDEGFKYNLNLEACTYGGLTAFQFACILQNQKLQKNLEKMGAEPIEPDDESDSEDLSDAEYNVNDNTQLSLVVN